MTKGDGGARLVDEERIAVVVRLLRERTGAEHAVVQPDLVAAAVKRRAFVTRTETEAYFTLALESPAETELLADEILGDTTSFFRDPGAFEILGRELDRIIAAKEDGESLRLWSIGCSTGEEAYSLAMLAREACDRQKKDLEIRVFATDVRAHAIDAARSGVYPPDAVAKLDDARRARWFVLDAPRGFRIRDELRSLVVFAVHDALQHAPIARMDVVTCRNLLPILREPSRERLLGVAYYALEDTGALMLGPDDRLEAFSDCFDVVDASARVFRRLPQRSAIVHDFLMMSMRMAAPSLSAADAQLASRRARANEVADLLFELRAAHEAELIALAQLEATQDQLRTMASSYAAYAALNQDQPLIRTSSAQANPSGLYTRVQIGSGITEARSPIERVSETLAATGTGVFGTTRERRVVWTCGRVLGRANEESVGESLEALLPPRDAEELAELAKISLDGSLPTRRAVVLTIEGRSTLVEVQVRPIAKAPDDTELAWFVHEL